MPEIGVRAAKDNVSVENFYKWQNALEEKGSDRATARVGICAQNSSLMKDENGESLYDFLEQTRVHSDRRHQDFLGQGRKRPSIAFDSWRISRRFVAVKLEAQHRPAGGCRVHGLCL